MVSGKTARQACRGQERWRAASLGRPARGQVSSCVLGEQPAGQAWGKTALAWVVHEVGLGKVVVGRDFLLFDRGRRGGRRAGAFIESGRGAQVRAWCRVEAGAASARGRRGGHRCLGGGPGTLPRLESPGRDVQVRRASWSPPVSKRRAVPGLIQPLRARRDALDARRGSTSALAATCRGWPRAVAAVAPRSPPARGRGAGLVADTCGGT